jgi:hypothetical protein
MLSAAALGDSVFSQSDGELERLDTNYAWLSLVLSQNARRTILRQFDLLTLGV